MNLVCCLFWSQHKDFQQPAYCLSPFGTDQSFMSCVWRMAAFIQKQRAHSATMFRGKTPAVLRYPISFDGFRQSTIQPVRFTESGRSTWYSHATAAGASRGYFSLTFKIFCMVSCTGV